MTFQNNRTQESGFALILALIIASVALSVGLSLLNITIKQLALSSTAEQSEISFQVAAAAMECLSLARYNIVNDADGSLINYEVGAWEDVECLGHTFTFGSPTGVGDAQVFNNQADWSINGNDYCFDTDLHVYTFDDDIQVRSLDKDCEGSLCYVGIARGYNHSCAEVQSGAVFAVEREITAEF